MDLFFSEVAQRLDFNRIKLIDKELFTDLPEGARREPDLIVEAHTVDDEIEIVLVHIEIQAKREKNISHRMWEYYCLLRLRLKRPVFPVVVYLEKGTGGFSQAEYTDTIFGQAINTFHYTVIGLPDLSAEEYLAKENVLAAALSALMRSDRMDRVMRKFRAWERLMRSPVDEARKHLLLDVVERYLELSESEAEEVRKMAKSSKVLDPGEYVTIFEERALRKGRKLGRQEGRQEGKVEGVLQGKREALLHLLQRRFGELPEGVAARIEGIENASELDILINRVLDARSLAEMGLMEV